MSRPTTLRMVRSVPLWSVASLAGKAAGDRSPHLTRSSGGMRHKSRLVMSRHYAGVQREQGGATTSEIGPTAWVIFPKCIAFLSQPPKGSGNFHMLYRRAFEKERHVRMLVTIGVCGAILGAASACTTCRTPVNAGIRAGSNTVGFGNRAGGPNYYCQPGVCQKTGRADPDYRVCPGGFGSQTAAGASAN